MKELARVKPKKCGYADQEEEDRLKALDHFETVQMDSFLKALAAEMFTDESNAFSLVLLCRL